jgi:hypothetical protein
LRRRLRRLEGDFSIGCLIDLIEEGRVESEEGWKRYPGLESAWSFENIAQGKEAGILDAPSWHYRIPSAPFLEVNDCTKLLDWSVAHFLDSVIHRGRR